MKRQPTIWLLTIWICITAGIMGCGEEPPPAPRAPVSQKITMPPKAAAAKSKVDTKETAPEPEAQKEAVPAAGSPVKPDAGPSQLVQESLKMVSSYDPTGRIDPFEPLFKNEAETAQVATVKGKREKRVPQTPLEKISLNQLKLTAVVRAPSGNYAMVEDATGKGYVITKGTYIGLNSGRVIEIGNDNIVVEEEIENVMGEIEIQNEELKLQKPAGEL